MGDLFRELFANLNTLLRIAIPGITALAFTAMLDSTDATSLRYWLSDPGFRWRFPCLGLLLGIVSYAAFMGAIEGLFMRLSLLWIRWRKDDGSEQYFTKRSFGSNIRGLLRERIARQASPFPRLRAMQDRLEKTYAWEIFLYCSAISTGATTGGTLLVGANSSTVLGLGLLALVFFALGFVADVNITRHEVWLDCHAKQWHTQN